MSTPESETKAITPDGLRALDAELEELEGPARRAIAARILAARELGDLKENADYHIAKEDQSLLETRIQRLQQRRREAVVVEASADGATFSFGCTAEVLDEATGKVHTWTIVGSTEANLAHGKLSAESPVAKALIGHAPGEAIEVDTPGGRRTYRVQALVR